MAIVTQDGGQSSVALGGQVVQYVEQLVAMQVPGAPDTLINQILQQVMREFYTKSTAWRADVGPYPVVSGQPVVDLNPVDQNRQLQFVLDAWLYQSENTNQPQPLGVLLRQPVGGTPEQPSRYYMKHPDRLQLYPTPDQNYGNILWVYASIVPTTTAVQLPDYAYTQHVDALQWGCLARLLMMKKRPWYDKEGAMMYQRQYRREILIARDIANRGYGSHDSAIWIPPFAGRAGSQVLPRATG